MKALHVCKTSNGAFWAVHQVAELVRNGVDVHVVLPSPEGAAIPAWQRTGASLHFGNCGLVTINPQSLLETLADVRAIIKKINPDLIHSHFVSTTLILRLALGTRHRIPRVFQVPGPLHLEHWHTRNLELALADENDYWIGSSQCIVRAYKAAGVCRERLFLSYYPADTKLFTYQRSGWLRHRLGIPEDSFVVGNINLIYPPKRYLGQAVGLKCHEDVIEAIALAQQECPNIWGVLIGSTFGNSSAYEKKLRKLAQQKGRGRIMMPGRFDSDEVARAWPDFDCAVHVPSSENCGGVVEPLLCDVPTIAGGVGGLPEVVHTGVTGELVPIHRPDVLASRILNVLERQQHYKNLARSGRKLVSTMFDPHRCAQEILKIYNHVLNGADRPEEFEPKHFLDTGAEETGSLVPNPVADIVEQCSA